MSTPGNPESGEKAPPMDLEAEIRKRVLSRERRFQLPAYLFIYEAIAFTQHTLGRDDPKLAAQERHVSGAELLEGIRQYAANLFGPLAPTVFRSWGLKGSQDFGEIVFILVECDLLGKTDEDRREDFACGFDFDTAFDVPIEGKPV